MTRLGFFATLVVVCAILFGCGGGGSPSSSTKNYASSGLALGGTRTGDLTLNVKDDGTATGQLKLNDPTRARTRALFTISLTGSSGASGFSLTGTFTTGTGEVFNVTVTGTLPTNGNADGAISIVLNGTIYAGNFAPSGSTLDRSLLLHTWTIVSLSKDGKTVNCPGEVTFTGGSTSCGSGTVTYNADGTASSSDGFKNTWSLSGNQLSQSTDSPNEIITNTITKLTSNELLIANDAGVTTRFTR